LFVPGRLFVKLSSLFHAFAVGSLSDIREVLLQSLVSVPAVLFGMLPTPASVTGVFLSYRHVTETS
jgi:hypothetical protein